MNRLLFILTVLLMLSCTGLAEPGQIADTVEVNLELCLEPDLSLDCTASYESETKAVADPEVSATTPLTSVISNFWIIQFNGTSDSSVLVGEPTYISDVGTFLKPDSEGGMDAQVKLAGSNIDNLVVILANTFEPGMRIPQGMSLSELKTKVRSVTGQESFLSESGNGRVMIFCGSATAVIAQGATVSCTLKRNVARAAIKIRNQSDDVRIESYQIRSVPSVSYYFTDYVLPEVFPAVGSFDKVDYPVVSALLDSKGSSADGLFYLPVNKWGINDKVTNEESKNRYAPNGATYLQVNAVAKSDNAPLTYRFYLGADMTTDFNILPNVSYSYDFVISSRGDAEFDTRVEEDLLVNFANTNDEVANCYMIHPASKDGKLRRFRIPVKIVDEFWGGKAGYEDVPENTLGPDGQWSVDVLVTDFDRSKLNFTVSSGKGSYDAVTADLKYFEFEVEAGTQGNAIVGLRKDGGPILWSWHLWITGYAPEEAFDHEPQSEIYAYEVSGGVVHRYEGPIWNDAYARRFMMDRNLGALDDGHPGYGNGSLYYQFGRKDPFFANDATGYSGFSYVRYEDIPEDGSDTYTVRYAVNNPLKYIETNRKAWTKNNKYNPEVFDGAILWQDPMTSKDRYPSTARNKSIFDPCPPGYCVPEPAVWDDFRANSSASPTTNLGLSDILLRAFTPFMMVKGLCYWPYPKSGGDDTVPSEVVYYPALGYMERLNVGDKSGRLFYGHTAKALGVDANVGLKFGMETVGPYLSASYYMNRNLGMPVRCVTSRDVRDK